MLDFDVIREVFEAGPMGLRLLDSCADDAGILETIRNNRPEMRFRLTYDGPLKAASNGKTRADEKWAIRDQIRPQLAELWQIHPALLGYQIGYAQPVATFEYPLDSSLLVGLNQQRLENPTERCGWRFLPLVRKRLMLTCSLDILFLRKDVPGSVVSNAGDLDNRMKTLLDGLRMPSLDELNGREPPDKESFHCLLEDDSLITAIAIRTDRLLSRPGAPANEVRLILDVIVSPTRIRTEINSGFIGDY